MKPYILKADVQKNSEEFLGDCEQLILILYWNIKDDFDYFIIGVHLLHFTKDPLELKNKIQQKFRTGTCTAFLVDSINSLVK